MTSTTTATVSDLASDQTSARDRTPSVSIVIPVYNEAENLEALFLRLHAVLGPYGDESEVILIDDGSRDESLGIMRSLRERDSRIKILSMARNFGHQVAISAGMQHA